MKNKRLLLLSTMFLSTSSKNTAKYASDSKTRKKAKAAPIGFFFVYLTIALYSGLIAWGMALTGFWEIMPPITASILWLLSFMFTIFKTNGYLFNFKEYDMLMAMPFSVKNIIADRFLYMYIKSLPWYVSVSLPMVVMYAVFGDVNVLGTIFFVLLSFIAPVIPMIIATGIGALIARIGAGFKHKKIVQAAITMIIVVPMFFSRFLFEGIFRNDEDVVNAIGNFSQGMSGVLKWIPPVNWFVKAVNEAKVGDFLLLLGTTIVLFELFFWFLAKYYRKINSELARGGAHTKAKANEIKKRGMVKSVAFKEMKRFLGSSTYMVNIGMGQFLATIVSIATCIIKPERIISVVIQGAPITPVMLIPAVPFIVHFFIGMVASTACSPSLEGKNYWVVDSLPINKLDLYKGKMLFNIYITVPFAVLSTFLMCVSAKAGVMITLLCVILSILLCLFETTFGMVCGIKHMKLEWENEIEIIKQGTAVTIYILPNMFITMGLCVLSVILGMNMNVALLLVIMIFAALLLVLFEYARVLKLIRKERK